MRTPDQIVHALVLARVRARLSGRIAWLRHLWSHEGTPTVRGAITHDEADATLEDRDDPERELEWLSANALQDRITTLDAELEAALEERDSRLRRIIERFELDDVEADVLQACLALELDPTLARLYAYANDVATRTYPTPTLVARVFWHGRAAALSSDARLRRWQLVAESAGSLGEPAAFAMDPGIRDWLLGSDAIDPDLAPFSRVQPVLEAFASWPIERAVGWFGARHLRTDQWHSRMRVVGAPDSGRKTFAAIVSDTLGLPLLAIDSDAISDDRWSHVFLRAQRMAILRDCALAWSGEALSKRKWPEHLPWCSVQFVIADSKMSMARTAAAIDVDVELSPLSTEERTDLWRRAVPSTETWPEAAFAALTRQERATVGQITLVARHGAITPEDVAAHLRIARRDALGELAQRLECPFGWNDLVVTAPLRKHLDELAYEARERSAFWEAPDRRRLFPRGRGLLALFSGPSGTGKTMAAQVLAKELGLDLFRLDLSTMVSKWVGETSKNLDRVLTRAAHLDVVLLFDEADALFGKRTEVKDAHDRFANTDTNHLLAAIETYPGIAILATNRKSDIDQAFTRRIRYALEFLEPDQATREAIWRRLVTELAGELSTRALEPQLRQLAASLKMTGAQIKYAILSALFIARRDGMPLAARHLARGLERELQKEGRPLDARVREVLAS
ncbi:ATP-binding protein [soil metagenome]